MEKGNRVSDKQNHQTAPAMFVDAAGVRFAHRRFGK